ncbi:hypothetical protein [Halomontanus rarus]|uniref:hypothetical protein n=1 Tax=Halomontanus rarus TaxID=3034020 RepID=UPI0023E77574|nr:hypothetical protein [Halovivax sp. TS33]
MPAKEQQDRTLSEYVVREAVEKGMDTPLRDVIVEAVDEAEGGSSGGRTLPLAGALVGLGAAAGYLLGSRETDFGAEDVSLESVEEPEIIDEVTGDDEDSSDEMGGALESETADGSSGSWLRRILIGVGIVAAVAFARRRMQSSEEDEWEPIEEFETAVSDEDEGEEEAEGEAEETEAESEDEEEAEAEQDEEEEEEEEE